MASKQPKSKQAYDKAYNARPEEKKKRAKRNAARAAYEKAHGDLPSDVDVNHKVAMKNGGTNDKDNLEAVPEKQNKGWRKGQKNYRVPNKK